jgi:hypothetical protein
MKTIEAQRVLGDNEFRFSLPVIRTLTSTCHVNSPLLAIPVRKEHINPRHMPCQ